MNNLVLFCCLLSTLSFGQSLDLGIQKYEKQHYHEVKSIFGQVSKDHPDFDQAQYYLGRVAFGEGNVDQATKYFRKAIGNDQNNAIYHFWLGNALGTVARESSIIKKGMLAPKIKKAFAKAVELDPKLIDAHWGLLTFYTEAPGFLGGSEEKAEQTAQKIKQLDRIEGHRALATVYVEQKKYDKAELEYVKMLELDSEHSMSLVFFYQNQKKYDKAFELLNKMYDDDNDNAGVLYQIGRTSAFSGQQSDLGIRSLTAYLDKVEQEGLPSHAAARMRMAMIYEKTNEQELAILFYQEALSSEPDMKLASEGLARLKRWNNTAMN